MDAATWDHGKRLTQWIDNVYLGSLWGHGERSHLASRRRHAGRSVLTGRRVGSGTGSSTGREACRRGQARGVRTDRGRAIDPCGIGPPFAAAQALEKHRKPSDLAPTFRTKSSY